MEPPADTASLVNQNATVEILAGIPCDFIPEIQGFLSVNPFSMSFLNTFHALSLSMTVSDRVGIPYLWALSTDARYSSGWLAGALSDISSLARVSVCGSILYGVCVVGPNNSFWEQSWVSHFWRRKMISRMIVYGVPLTCQQQILCRHFNFNIILTGT